MADFIIMLYNLGNCCRTPCDCDITYKVEQHDDNIKIHRIKPSRRGDASQQNRRRRRRQQTGNTASAIIL